MHRQMYWPLFRRAHREPFLPKISHGRCFIVLNIHIYIHDYDCDFCFKYIYKIYKYIHESQHERAEQVIYSHQCLQIKFGQHAHFITFIVA